MNFKILAETISEKQYLDVKDLEQQLEFFFKLYLSEIDMVQLDDVNKKRQQIYINQSELSQKRTNLEQQLLLAKNKIHRREYVDLDWMARLNSAFRITKQQLNDTKNQLTILSSVEKSRNIERSEMENNKLRFIYKEFIKDNFGEEKLKELTESITSDTQK